MKPFRTADAQTSRVVVPRWRRTLRRHRSLLALLFAATATSAAPPAARAQSPSTSASGTALEQAREKYQRGAEAYKAGRYQEAIDHFLEADKLASSPAFAFNVAVAYEDMGDRARALHWFRTYLRRAPAAKDRADVERRMTRLQNELRAKGVQQVSVESTPEGAEVTLDGRPVGKTPWAGEVPPGKHVVVLRLSRHRDARQEFVLSAEESTSVSLPLVAAPAPVTGEPSSSPRAQERSEVLEAPGIRPLTWISLGVGVAALGGALGFELARAAAEDEAREAPTQIEAADAADTMADRRTVARVFLGVGAAAAVAGGVLLVIDLTRDPVPRSASRDGASGDTTGHRAERTLASPVRAGLGCHTSGCSAVLDGAF